MAKKETEGEALNPQQEKLKALQAAMSKIENGVITPSVGVFYRIIAALGMRVEVVKPVY